MIAPRTIAIAVLAVAATTVAVSAAPRTLVPVPRSAVAADSLVTRLTPSSERLAAFRAWARDATLDDLMYVLRRTGSELRDLEALALEAALARAPADRTELREWLSTRQAQTSKRRGRRGSQPAVATAAASVSTFRVALLLPGDGEQGDDATALETGFRSGLASRAVPGRPPVECLIARTGGDEPAEVAAAFDSVSRLAALVCGGFRRPSAQLLAAASRWSGLPALLPAVDEPPATRLSPRAWAIGPAAEDRADTLAAAVKVGPNDRVATITSSTADTAFAGGFVAACRTRGATVSARFGYSPGNASFAAEARALISQRVTVLFWDGDAAEAAALLRQLTRDRVSLRICGGDGLDPARHHRETRVFLEGVVYVPLDWSLSEPAWAAMNQDSTARGTGPAGPLHLRGWLAGRVAGAALATGAYSPAELSAAIARLSPEGGSLLRVLGVQSEGAELPAYSVSGGRATRVQ